MRILYSQVCAYKERPLKNARKKGPVARRKAARKQAKNLTLDADAIRNGEAYSRKHRTTLSRLVGDLLRALPTELVPVNLTPAVRRLRGVAEGAGVGVEDYHEYLRRKYGGD